MKFTSHFCCLNYKKNLVAVYIVSQDELRFVIIEQLNNCINNKYNRIDYFKILVSKSL